MRVAVLFMILNNLLVIISSDLGNKALFPEQFLIGFEVWKKIDGKAIKIKAKQWKEK